MNNYHTHTYRCNHASGNDEDYIKYAIKAGFKTLGFSDHTPWHYKSGYISHMRMRDYQLEEYVGSLSILKDKYKDKIKILIGLEVEYFPEYMDDLLEMVRKYHIDYLILGNHFELSDEYGIYFGYSVTKEKLTRYVDLCIEGLQTGYFSYLAHPDLVNYRYKDEYYRKEMERLCLKAKELDIPLEYNLLGYNENRHYPSKQFFDIVSKVGNKVIIGYDAHIPYQLSYTDSYNSALKFLKDLNIEVVDCIKLLDE